MDRPAIDSAAKAANFLLGSTSVVTPPATKDRQGSNAAV